MSNQENFHPALERFKTRDDGSSRLLLVKATAGTGRCWFATSWIGNRRGEVHDWSHDLSAEPAKMAALATRIQANADLFVAVILSPTMSTLTLSAHLSTLVAGPRDLLLDASETVSFLQEEHDVGPNLAHSIHGLCGGWLRALQALAVDPTDREPARQVIRSSLAVWLESQESQMELSDAAYLPRFDGPTIESFYGEFSPVVHTLSDLITSGFVYLDEKREWIMPTVVREVLTEFAGRLGSERIAILESAAAHATVLNNGILEAMDSALTLRRWSSVLDLLLHYWADIFTKDPATLSGIMAKVPRFIAEQTEFMTVAVRMLDMAGREGMDLQLPAFAPDYASDVAAQRLHRDTTRLYRNPSARAVTLGMMELCHLRISGHFREAGQAALRLRRAQITAVEDARIKSTLAAFAALEVGISLQLAGRENDALHSYEAAHQLALSGDNAFLVASTAGKLALISALQGNLQSARMWVVVHDESIARVEWGQKDISIAAILASAYVAASRLEFDVVGHLLGSLPRLPDHREFWAVHAYLIALQRIMAGIPEAARTLIQTLLEERSHSAASPMAARLLDEALFFAAFFESSTFDARGKSVSNSLLAWNHLMSGSVDAAIDALERSRLLGETARWRNLAIYCEIAARNPGVPSARTIKRVSELFKHSKNLGDLSLLVRLPGWIHTSALLGLSPEELRRLRAATVGIPLPATQRILLTAREIEILGQLRSGLRRREIAKASFRSENTVKTQLQSLYRKLEASNAKQALANARALRL